MKSIINKILEFVLIKLLWIMLISVIWQVFSRFVLQAPSTFTDEISSYSLIWLGLLGAAYATGKKLHLAIDLLPKTMVDKSPIAFNAVIAITIFSFALLVMVIGGIRLCWLTFVFQQKSAALQIPLGYIYTVIPLSGFLICYYSGAYFMVKSN